jgi:hypothetical protein
VGPVGPVTPVEASGLVASGVNSEFSAVGLIMKSNCASCPICGPSFETKETNTSLAALVLGFVEKSPMPLFVPGF